MDVMTEENTSLDEQLEAFLEGRPGERWKSADVAEHLGIDDKRAVSLALGALHKSEDSAVQRVDHGIYAVETAEQRTQRETSENSHEPHSVEDAFLFEQDPTMVQRSFTVVAPHGKRGVLLMDDHSDLWIAKRAEVVEAD